MNQSPQQQQQYQRRKFQKIAQNSENFLKMLRKFLKKKVFFEALISYRYRIVSRKKPSYRIDIVSSRKKGLSPKGGPDEPPILLKGQSTTLKSLKMNTYF